MIQFFKSGKFSFDFDIGAGIVCPNCGGKLRPHQI